MSQTTQNSSDDQREKLDSKTELEWKSLSDKVINKRLFKNCSQTNEILLASANRYPESPAAPVLRLWSADNLAMDGLYPDAIKAYDHTVNACQSVKSFLSNTNLISGALTHKAQALNSIGDPEGAIKAYNELIDYRPSDKLASLEAGIIAERIGKYELAMDSYKRIACSSYSVHTDDYTQLAKRGLDRLNSQDVVYCKSANELASILTLALEDRDTGKLKQLVSKTHFSIGPVGGHTGFVNLDLFDYFLKDL